MNVINEKYCENALSQSFASSIEGFVRAKEACKFLGIGRSSFYAIQQEGSSQFDESFPKSYRLSGRTRVWSKVELIAWVESRVEEASIAGGIK